ncbi:MAG TPA: FAD-binding protein [Smithella sp.]|nr:FAD-binding protein [Smithella sp.]
MRVLRLSGIKLALDETEELLAAKAAAILGITASDISAIEIVKRAIDARRHRPPHFVYVLNISIPSGIKLPAESSEGIQLTEVNDRPEIPVMPPASSPKLPVVVVGSGPAGLFAAYILAKRGIPAHVLDRGTPVEKRTKDVEEFWKKGILCFQSNVFFGEGGAGTFSDGKLTNRTNSPFALWVKNVLVKMGAPPEILTDAKPHIGTDQLRRVIVNLRKSLMDMGCRIEFEAQVTDLIIRRGNVTAVIVNNREEVKTGHVILAIGQSADDTYAKLLERGVQMEAKPFAMGLRVEHPQALINSIQYGKWHPHPQLPPAEYFIKASIPDLNRSVYTFCMCPGGSVIGCGAFSGYVITNGMSNARRSGEFANSAIVVNARVDDFTSGNQPLDGLKFRQIWEEKAYLAGGSNYKAPAQKVMDFLQGRAGGIVGRTSFLPGVNPAALQELLPEFITQSLKRGIREFDKKMPGFITEDAHLIGVETRTSSPVRICRGNDGQSKSILGLYPCGEGAGYAGGIISSALDGIRAAQNLMNNLS